MTDINSILIKKRHKWSLFDWKVHYVKLLWIGWTRLRLDLNSAGKKMCNTRIIYQWQCRLDHQITCLVHLFFVFCQLSQRSSLKSTLRNFSWCTFKLIWSKLKENHESHSVNTGDEHQTTKPCSNFALIQAPANLHFSTGWHLRRLPQNAARDLWRRRLKLSEVWSFAHTLQWQTTRQKCISAYKTVLRQLLSVVNVPNCCHPAAKLNHLWPPRLPSKFFPVTSVSSSQSQYFFFLSFFPPFLYRVLCSLGNVQFQCRTVLDHMSNMPDTWGMLWRRSPSRDYCDFEVLWIPELNE